MAFTSKLAYNPLQSIAGADITSSYQAVGDPLASACCIVKIVNNTNAVQTISTDGVTDMDILPAASFALYDATSDSPNPGGGLFFPEGTQFLVKGSSSTGSLYIVSLYPITLSQGTP